MRLMTSSLVNRPALLIAATVAVLASGSARAGFVDPIFYGQANTTYQLWDGFSSAGGPNDPTDKDNPNSGTFDAYDSSAAANGTILAGGNHLYSFMGIVTPRIEFPNFNLGSDYQTEIVLQANVQGNPLDLDSFTLTADSGGASFSPKSATDDGTGFYTVEWTVTGNAASYTLNFAASDLHSAQNAYRVDTLASAVPNSGGAVPEPASIASISIGLFAAGLWGMRHRRTA
jgi:hypothetical protein